MLKIATWNVNSIKVRLTQVLDWLAATSVDILAIQETKSIDENFPAQEIESTGYHVIFAGQKTYNGMAIISKKPIKNVVTDLPKLDDPQRRVLGASIGSLRILNVYVPNGQEVGSEKFSYKLDWLKKLRDYVKQQLFEHKQFVLLGDFNIAPEPRDVYDPVAWEGKVLFSEPERKAFQSLIRVGLTDSFRLFDQEEKQYSWWDYRMLGFRRNHGLRIDHILISDAMVTRCKASYIDKAPRRLERPSDHTPVVAEFTQS